MGVAGLCTWTRNGTVLQACRASASNPPRGLGEARACYIYSASKQARRRCCVEGKQRQEYQKVSVELETKVAKYAAENGIKAAVKFQDQVPNAPKN